MNKSQLQNLVESDFSLHTRNKDGSTSESKILQEKNKWEEGWSMSFKIQKREISKLGLTASQLSIFIFLETSAKMDSGEVYTAPLYLARETGCSTSRIYEAIHVLISKNILIEFEDKIYLNPQICWQGSFKNWQKTVVKLKARKLIEPKKVELKAVV